MLSCAIRFYTQVKRNRGGGKRGSVTMQYHYKDEGLNRLSERGYNVAQFASHDTNGVQRYSRTLGQVANYEFETITDTAEYILTHSTEHSINVRSFDPLDPKSKPFEYGLTRIQDAVTVVEQRHTEGLYTIINETISVDDGGVSGVIFGDVIEFAPHDTPRCVEKPGTVQFTRSMGTFALKSIYGFIPNFPVNPNLRVEFSIHPLKHGYQHDHTIVWETEEAGHTPLEAETQWPNRFSDMLGDKTFGLVIADQIGLYVPKTTVFNRTVKPFEFGRSTGSHEVWLRTAPNKQTPGLYTTIHGWTDPYKLLEREDPKGEAIASILSQESVEAQYSGACVMSADEELIIEGKSGTGDGFMVGEQPSEELPEYIRHVVGETYRQAASRLGPVRFEWVYDGTHVWVVQLHRGKSTSTSNVIYPGEVETRYIDYDASLGIEGLRELIAAHVTGTGITLHGNVGVTSHFGDLLRKAAIPSKLIRT